MPKSLLYGALISPCGSRDAPMVSGLGCALVSPTHTKSTEAMTKRRAELELRLRSNFLLIGQESNGQSLFHRQPFLTGASAVGNVSVRNVNCIESFSLRDFSSSV